MKKRPDWDTYFMSLAHLVSTRASCPRASVGAVLTQQNRIIATGYNGAIAGRPDCLEAGCLMENDHCIRSIHAEENALFFAGRNGVKVDSATMYSTAEPCYECAQAIIQHGVRRVVYDYMYRNNFGLMLLQESGVIVDKLG